MIFTDLNTSSTSSDHLIRSTGPAGVQPVAGAVGSARVERLAPALRFRAVLGHLTYREQVAFGARADGIWKPRIRRFVQTFTK